MTGYNPIQDPRRSRSGYQDAVPGQDEVVDTGGFFASIMRNKYLIGAVAFFSAIVAAAILVRLEPIYVARAELLLETGGSRVIAIENVVDDPTLGTGTILSEIAILRSRGVLEEVSRRLQLHRYAEFNPELQEKSTMSVVTGAARQAVRDILGDGDEGGSARARSDSAPVIRTHEEVAANILRSKTRAAQQGLSHVIDIRVTSSNSRRAARIANTIVEVYLERQLDDKFAASETAIAWLSTRVEDLSRQLEEAEQSVEDYRAGQLLDDRSSPEVIDRQLAELAVLLVRARDQLAEERAQAQRFVELVDNGNYASALDIGESQVLATLEQRRANLRRQISTVVSQTGGGSVGGLENQLSAIDAEIDAETAEVATALNARVDIARERVDQLRAEITGMERLQSEKRRALIGLRELEREAEALRTVYGQFLTRLRETSERGGFQQANARLVTPAQPPVDPAGPQKVPLLILAMLAGGLVASASVVLRDLQRPLVRGTADVRSATNRSLLATMPKLRDATPRALLNRLDGGDTAATEAEVARRLRALLMRPGAKGSVRSMQRDRGAMPLSILVTSAGNGHDTEQLALLLARAGAEAGRNVLLAEADPENGMLVETLAPELAPIGPGCVSEIADGLSVGRLMSAPDDNPIRELDAALDDGQEAFDMVVIHAAPVLTLSAALDIAARSDRVVLTARQSWTVMADLKLSAEELARVDAPLAGVVLTGVPEPRRWSLLRRRKRRLGAVTSTRARRV